MKASGLRFVLRVAGTVFTSHSAWSQYQGLSIKQFMDAVLPFIEGRDVVTYGASLGAYAAFISAGQSVRASSAPRPCNLSGQRSWSSDGKEFP